MLRGFFLLLLLATLAPNLSAQSDNYRAFEWDIIQIGYASPVGKGYTDGFAFGTEVRYNITDRISAGINLEIALFGAEGGNKLLDIGATGGYTLTGDYYFVEDRTTRPFAGFGVGLYSGGAITLDSNGPNDPDAFGGGSTFGVSPRVGVELGHLRIALEYNLAFGDSVPSYIGITFSPTLFGGLK
ncbi:outer membrane beta-barrel protein [Neolewinella antarctica]|uniref:Outer membrane protein X n=1 Tax=Neolewinella antarctica TaxID=442734 RepID=A0ABX0XCP7_9BACT|nr:outer membrane beta-barrel protein [Neolewinella antarctica]NJC27054.1 outer membrane protein X [Neolewinella antarctica]